VGAKAGVLKTVKGKLKPKVPKEMLLHALKLPIALLTTGKM
jgi:hypothetical protein